MRQAPKSNERHKKYHRPDGGWLAAVPGSSQQGPLQVLRRLDHFEAFERRPTNGAAGHPLALQPTDDSGRQHALQGLLESAFRAPEDVPGPVTEADRIDREAQKVRLQHADHLALEAARSTVGLAGSYE